MVLSSFDLDISETELRDRCDCTPFGTEALKAIDAIRDLGFLNSVKCTLSFDELVSQVEGALFPIVFVNLLPIDGIREAHAIVVIAANSSSITVYDPSKSERILPVSTFVTAWTMMNNLAILVIP